MDKDTIVFCKNCVKYEKFLKYNLEYFGCRTDCEKCECWVCNCLQPTFGVRFEDRPEFVRGIISLD